MNFWEFLFKFAYESPFLFFIVICSVYYGWKYPWQVLRRKIRSSDIQKHGWPTAPHMDADGDLVYPSKDDD